MKRSTELMRLSRDHHVALEAALRLRRAESATVADDIARFEEFWRERGRRHFEIEEQILLPAIGDDDPQWAAAAQRVRSEHDDIRERASVLRARAGGIGVVEEAHELGDLLNDHVRYEERELFAMVEERLTPDELAALGAALERAEAE